jgi:hypothetical protein
MHLSSLCPLCLCGEHDAHLRLALRPLILSSVFILASLAFLGCARVGGDDLVIATAWPASERAAIEAGFQRWLASKNERKPVRIGWVVLAPSDDPARVARRRWPADLILGGPASTFRRMEREARLVPADREGRPAWLVARRAPIVLARNAKAAQGGKDPSRTGLTFDDPRHDEVSLAWARGVLRAGDWAEGYARLVRSAGAPRRVGRVPGSALAAVERGEVVMAPAILPPDSARSASLDLEYLADENAPEWVEGVAVVRGGPHPDRAQEFLRFLVPSSQGQPEPPEPPEEDALLADLLGATLVDAQDELRAAWAMITASGDPSGRVRWMAEPPPWPPASVAVLLDRGEDGMALLDTLAAEIAPEADTRSWLLRSWLRTSRPIDGAFLAELATAADGRLAREPRFRAWLRAEWTAWARQRYQAGEMTNGK